MNIPYLDLKAIATATLVVTYTIASFVDAMPTFLSVL